MPSSNETELRASVLALLRSPKYRPSDKVEISKALGGQPEKRALLRQVLRNLEQSGEVARIRKNRYVLPDAADLASGKLQLNQAGYGFVVTEKPGEADIFVAAENTGTAMHGDRVVVRITRGAPAGRPASSGTRAEGRIIRILERAHTTIVGTLQRSPNFFYVVPDDPRFVHNIYVQVPGRPPLELRPNIGDKVVVRLDVWESRHVNPEGEIIEILGPASAPGVDMLSIIRKYHLPTEFPPAVLRAAEAIPESVEERMLVGREDLRRKFIVTIDPDDARDFDDAINVEEVDGGWHLGVHIADVSAYVTPGNPLDREASRRGNSVYLADRVIPMLPERLSNGVCSLNPDVDRLTHSAFIKFTNDGKMKGVRFAKTVIRSARRLTYKQAYAILREPPRDELGIRLHTAWKLAALLRRKRFENGSLDLDFPEVKVWLDEAGKPVRLERVENDESHQLVEEFMLAANEAVARELKNRMLPVIYRVHENPDPEKLAEYREFVLSYGFKAGDLTQRKELQRLLAATRGKPEEQAIKIGLLKSLKRARYSPQPLGHYGLAKSDYTHFTSPIRRYADLVVHRVLAEASLNKRGRGDMSQMTAIAEHISTTERTASDAENDSVKMKKLEFFQQQLAERKPQAFRAMIVDVRNYGILVELPDVLLTGLVHISSIKDDFYSFDPSRRRLLGRQSKAQFAIGDELQVHVARVDVFKRQVDFAIAAEPRKALPDRKQTRRRRR